MSTLDESDPLVARAAHRLRTERMGWITTVRADGQPQPSGVWFQWDGTDILVLSRPGAAKLRNVRANSRVAFHLDGDGLGDDLVIAEGTVEVLLDGPGAARRALYLAKYHQAIADVLETTPEKMVEDFSIGLLITPTRWRIH